MKELSLPSYSYRISGTEGDEKIFDPVRRRFVKLTPEEWVRQHFLNYLISYGGYPAGLIGVEVQFRLNSLSKRVDILIHDRSGKPVMIVECKEPGVKLDEKVFDQIMVYNLRFRVPYLIVTNGMQNFAYRMDFTDNSRHSLEIIPQYDELTAL
ncbi:MAG TPA: type I restriction enzyme HsdR N-terminal domain-containing protein [Bacteroidales bacterium]|nr:type I restriction enzyme HsdR N-terminal domain-containing protein [Bacteroidales bacterium]